MGLIYAALGSVVGTLSETWKDYFVCDSLNNNALMVKGVKKGGGGSGEVITNGSGIVVNEGQCALIVDEGNVLEVAAEPGNYTFDSTASPSIFDNGMKGVKDTFKEMLTRFTYGGSTAKNQRVYYVNTKEIMGNMFGTTNPIPFRIVDKNIGLDVDVAIRCNGEYTFRIVNPLLFYKNVAGNKATYYSKDEISSIMKAEMLNALQPAFAKISEQGIRYSEVPMHTAELAQALNEALNAKWAEQRGIELVNIAFNSATLSKEDEEKIRDLQMSAVNRNKDMAVATIIGAQADAMRDAAKNENGALAGFYNVNAAVNAGNAAAELLRSADLGGGQPANSWVCGCGNVNTDNYCPKCGQPRPQQKVCPKCGAVVAADANFCPKCGQTL